MKIQTLDRKFRPILNESKAEHTKISNYGLQTDKFEKSASLSFKGIEVTKQHILDCISGKVKTDFSEFFKNPETFRETLVTLKAVLNENFGKFWDIADENIKLPEDERYEQARECHDRLNQACEFFEEIQLKPKYKQFLNRLSNIDDNNMGLIHPIYRLAARSFDQILVPQDSVESSKDIEEWVRDMIKRY